MALVLNEDQQILKQTAADFVRRESPLSRVRELRDSDDSDGFSRGLWAQMAELGWSSILVPEEYGGLSMGYLEMACVLEECGRNLVPEPLLSTAVMGVSAIVAAGSEEQKRELLPRVVDGSLLLALAHHERGARYDVFDIATVATPKPGGFVLSGKKSLVLDGHVADVLIVAARSNGERGDRDGISLFLVDPNSPGVTVEKHSTIDLRNAALVTLADVEVAESSLLGELGQGGAVLEDVVGRAVVALSAEMLGNIQGACEMTLEYLKTRKQFGVLIGSFQALKHRAAIMFVETELARSTVLGACDAIDSAADNWLALASVAKARCSDTAVLVGHEGIQMHGGIGMTDEHDIGFFAKRARASELTFGDAAYHRRRFAGLSGF